MNVLDAFYFLRNLFPCKNRFGNLSALVNLLYFPVLLVSSQKKKGMTLINTFILSWPKTLFGFSGQPNRGGNF